MCGFRKDLRIFVVVFFEREPKQMSFKGPVWMCGFRKDLRIFVVVFFEGEPKQMSFKGPVTRHVLHLSFGQFR